MQTSGQVASDRQPVAGHEWYGVAQVEDLVRSPHLHQVLGALGSIRVGGSGSGAGAGTESCGNGRDSPGRRIASRARGIRAEQPPGQGAGQQDRRGCGRSDRPAGPAEPSVEFGGQVFRRRVTSGRARVAMVLRQTRSSRRGDAGRLHRRAVEIATAGAVSRFGLRLRGEGRPAGQQIIERGPEREDVRERADPVGLEPRLLGGDVGVGPSLAGRGRVGPRVLLPGQPEVDEPGPAGLVDQDVGRFDVLMDDPPAMREGDRSGQLADQRGGAARGDLLLAPYCDRVRARMYSITRNGRPSWKSRSCTRTMLGCSSPASCLPSSMMDERPGVPIGDFASFEDQVPLKLGVDDAEHIRLTRPFEPADDQVLADRRRNGRLRLGSVVIGPPQGSTSIARAGRISSGGQSSIRRTAGRRGPFRKSFRGILGRNAVRIGTGRARGRRGWERAERPELGQLGPHLFEPDTAIAACAHVRAQRSRIRLVNDQGQDLVFRKAAR